MVFQMNWQQFHIYWKLFLGFNSEHSAQNVPICRCMIHKFDICQLYFLFDLLILQINKNLPNFIIALFLRCHVYGPKWFVMIHKREEMLTISWIEYEWNDIVICCLTPSLINKRPYKGLLSFNKINTNGSECKTSEIFQVFIGDCVTW